MIISISTVWYDGRRLTSNPGTPAFFAASANSVTSLPSHGPNDLSLIKAKRSGTREDADVSFWLRIMSQVCAALVRSEEKA